MNKDEYISEIQQIVSRVKIAKVLDSFYKTSCKDFDSYTFPNYYSIEKYIEKEEKFENYFKAILKTLEEYKSYVSKISRFTIKYDFSELNKYLSNSCKVIGEIYSILKIDKSNPSIMVEVINENKVAKVSDGLIEPSLCLADGLIKLTNKAYTYVKRNSFFGRTYRDKYNHKSVPDEKILGDIQKHTSTIDTIIKKPLISDFLDDGSKDLGIMMPAIFKGISLLSLVKKEIINQAYDNKISSKDLKINKYVEKILVDKYSFLDNVISNDYLSNYSTEDLSNMLKALKEINIEKEIGIDMSGLGSGKGERELSKLIGLAEIKESILKLKAYFAVNADKKDLNLHMCFYGNPGTGKTEVARIIAQILYENKILPTNKLVETDRQGLVGEYVGETPLKTQSVIDKAMGGVLFIDEAYSLVPDKLSFDYGNEAVATLIKNMEDKRGKFCVIFAGYKNKLEEMISTNPGFESRIQFHLDFPNYSKDELGEILELMAKSRGYQVSLDAKDKILDLTDVLKKNVNFANAREIRNILDQTIMCLNLRDKDSKVIDVEDVNKYIKDKKITLPTNNNKVLSASEELDELIGLEAIKKSVNKIRAYAKKNKDSNLNLHMCFYGNPGTGKTEVARIISRLLHESGVLPEAKLIETNPNGLIAEYVGQTGPKTEKIIKEALGGVLFIDEAYGLVNGYGNEAISTLLKEMEDKRGQFCVVLAGYKNEMKHMLSTNPGFESRIQFELDFPDYSDDEFKLIAKKMLSKEKLDITDEALDKVIEILNIEREKKTFANARSLRNILDKIVLNQTLRTEDEINDNLVIIDDVVEYIEENGINISASNCSIKPLFNELLELYNSFDSSIVDTDYLEQIVISISGNDSEGTGFIISDNGLCLTCNHCIIDGGVNQNARIIFNAGKKKIKTYSKFTVLKQDVKNDIALIKLEEDNEYDYIALEDISYQYKPLNEFIMGGFPFGGESFNNISITDGKIASVNYIDDRKVVFANMFGKPGNSGSPVIDKNSKKVIGIYWGGIKKSDEMLNCFTPVDIIWNILKQ